MLGDPLGNGLEALGVVGGDVRCLLLLPQVYVGWASQQRDPPALAALLEATASRAKLGSKSVGPARHWLLRQPTRAQFQGGFAWLRVLRRAPVDPLIVTSDLFEAMLWASYAARLDREPVPRGGRRGPVTLAARRALAELETWLEIETQGFWHELLSDDETPPNQFELLSEKFDALSDAELENAMASLEVVDEHSAVRVREDEGSAPAAAPFPLVRRA